MSRTEKGSARHSRRRSAQMPTVTPAARAGARDDKVIVDLGGEGESPFDAAEELSEGDTHGEPDLLDGDHLEFDDDERSQRFPAPKDASGKDALIGMLVHDSSQPDEPLERVRAAPGEVPHLHSDAGLYTMWVLIIGLIVAGGAFGVWAVFFYRPL